MKKSIKSKYLLLPGLILLILKYIIGGVIGDALGLIGLIVFIMGIIAWFRERKEKKRKREII